MIHYQYKREGYVEKDKYADYPLRGELKRLGKKEPHVTQGRGDKIKGGKTKEINT